MWFNASDVGLIILNYKSQKLSTVSSFGREKNERKNCQWIIKLESRTFCKFKWFFALFLARFVLLLSFSRWIFLEPFSIFCYFWCHKSFKLDEKLTTIFESFNLTFFFQNVTLPTHVFIHFRKVIEVKMFNQAQKDEKHSSFTWALVLTNCSFASDTCALPSFTELQSEQKLRRDPWKFVSSQGVNRSLKSFWKQEVEKIFLISFKLFSLLKSFWNQQIEKFLFLILIKLFFSSLIQKLLGKDN